MAGILDFYGYDSGINDIVSQKQQQANIDNAQDEKIKELEQGGGTPKQLLIQTTYSELKSLRDNSQLIPGSWYRITDYECTTTQAHTKSAGHQFDILVLATSVNTLSEEARALNSARDELQSIYSNSQSANFIRYPEADGDFEGKHYYAFLDQDTHEDFIYTESLSTIPTEQNVFVTTTSVDWEEDGDSFVPLDEAIAIITFAEHHETVASYTGLYFSKCNLNAWKIWYCLDNDTSRFAWAADYELPEGVNNLIRIDDSGTTYIYMRYPQGDTQQEYAFVYCPYGDDISIGEFLDNESFPVDIDDIVYAFTDKPGIYDKVYYSEGSGSLYPIVESSYSTGVIYRMIDENNNDCPYDFKNIMYYEPVDNLGMYDPNSSNYEYCYTFNFYDGVSRDYTIYNLGLNYIINNYIGSYSVNANGFPKCYLPHIIRFNYDEGDGYIENIIIKENCHDIVLGPYSTSIHIGCKCYNIVLGEYSKRVTIDSECHDISVVNLDDDGYFGLQDSYIGSLCQHLKLETDADLYNIKVMARTGGSNNNPLVITDLTSEASHVQCIGITTNSNVRIWNPADPSGT